MGSEHGGMMTVAPAVLRAWRDSPAFARVESATARTAVIDRNGLVVARGSALVTRGVFNLVGGVAPIRGRLFDQTDGRPGTDDRILLSEDLWRGLYGADPSIIGSRVSVDGEPLVVVGVLPSAFRFPAWDTMIWRAVDFDAPSPSRAQERPSVYVRFSTRLPRADAVRLATESARAADPVNATLRPWIQPIARMVIDPYYERAVPLLAGGVALVFLVLSANVCSLFLAQLVARQRDFSVCSALGASRGRLLRQALLEGGMVGCAGILAGGLLAWFLVSLSRAFLPDAFLLRTLNPLRLDTRALTVAAISGLTATIGTGLLPGWLGTRVNVAASLGAVGRGGTETRVARVLSRTLLVSEIAFACMLLIGATLLTRSFINLTRASPGIDVDGVVTATFSLLPNAFPNDEARRATARAIEEELVALPGVQRTAGSFGLPPQGGAISFGNWRSDVPGAQPVDMAIDRYRVGPDFFALYGIPVLRGRTFRPGDTAADVIVGERLAQRLWPDLDPVGRGFAFQEKRFHVIGMVREIAYPSLDPARDRPEFYELFPGVGSYAMISLRCGPACPPTALVRQRLAASHPGVRVEKVSFLRDVYFEEIAQPRAAAALGLTFAAIAVAAAAGGLYSVLSYTVGRRRREFGIRSALGASPARIRRLVLRDGVAVALMGMAIGSLAGWWLSRATATLQYGITPADPSSWAFVIVLLACTTVGAAWRPARQAAHVDPVTLLRDE
jgi:predicted permease